MPSTATLPAPGTPAAPPVPPITDPVNPAAPPVPPIQAPPAVPPVPPAAPPVAPPVDPSAPPPNNDPAKDPAKDPAGTPVVYDLKLPAESTLDPAVIERTAAIARSLGLSNEAAQTALDLVHQEVSSATESIRDATLESLAPGGDEWTKQLNTWAKETMADPALGATPADRRAAIGKGQAVLAKFTEANPADGEAFKHFLNETGYANHPAAARFFAWLGRSASEGTIDPGSPSSTKEKTLAEIFYPKGAGRTREEIRADGSSG